MKVKKDVLKKRLAVAARKTPADKVFKNGQIIDVFNGTLMTGDVAIVDDTIVGIGDFEGHIEIDATNKYISPGFIDSHVHIESSMVTPSQFARVVLPHGVTTVIADPHEIANVSGTIGIEFMLDDSEGIPLHVFLMLPSCVPATPFENSGANLQAKDLAQFYTHPRVLGLGEVMDYPSVHHNDDVMIEKIFGAQVNGKIIDGHAAGLNNNAINVYRTAGIRTDHEAVTKEEAEERLKRGMYLLIREGSVAKDLTQLLKVVTNSNSRRCAFCTDDKHIDDLIQEGSVDHNVRLAIQKGISPITAIQMATINAAECYKLDNKGAIAPGFDADIILLDSLQDIAIDEVYSSGQLVAKKGRFLIKEEIGIKPGEDIISSVHATEITEKDITLSINEKQLANVISIIPNSLITKHIVKEVKGREGAFVSDIENDLLKLAVIERHHYTGNVGLGIVHGLKLKRGAIATTIAHDSHNMIVTGTSDKDMLFAIKSVEEIGGGLVVVSEEKVIASLPLHIAGLITDDDYEIVYKKLNHINDALSDIGISQDFNPFLTLSFLALPVIPALKLTDIGLFNVDQFKHINLFET
ncbi:adenine deaminase [Evansella cellulosilytica]|uniref:Adenine deaminase n=1 Tax=Evansella cellulosilytica (strain ATCC 21833 / DSM 2522 / FERM P-1141 / JCM 9156 / N-4) TaxID=649639 RepID=E6U0V7_EVAC2|nr:adenine deaminase [Evansella cellulosilytica]ADU30269.1 adenine deaminase [Evansella cellulosilytica DSM 2522]